MNTRRDFLKSSALVCAASIAGIAGAPKFTFGKSTAGKTLVKVFMRGGADGLELFPMVGDPLYYSHRPNIAIAPPSADSASAIDLGHSRRAMNPNLHPLMDIWSAGRMMVSPSTALAECNRSHFDCQKWIGTGAKDNLIDGYFNRYLQNVANPDHVLRAAVLGKPNLSPEMLGPNPVPSIVEAERFRLQEAQFCSDEVGCEENRLTEMLHTVAMQENGMNSAERRVRESQLVLLESIDQVKTAAADYERSDNGLEYSSTPLGRGLKLVALLLKGGVPLELASIDWNLGWDTHSNQGSPFFNQGLTLGATDFATFFRDIGEALNDVVVLVGTEFGRTIGENGSKGTDHGHSGAWFAFGGPTVSGVARDVSTLDSTAIGNDTTHGIPTVVDYRDVVGEIMIRHMGMQEKLVSTVFLGHQFSDNSMFRSLS